MEKNLIIDGNNLGPALGCRQNRKRKQWVFLMKAGYFISVDWSSISRFESSGNWEIQLFRDRGEN